MEADDRRQRLGNRGGRLHVSRMRLDPRWRGVGLQVAARGKRWITLFSPTLDTDTGDSNPYGVRFTLATSLYDASAPATATKIRLTFAPPVSGANGVFSAAWVGHQGAAAPNFDGNQVQLKFGGANGFTLTAGGASVTSDAATFNFDKTKALIVSFGVTNWRGRSHSGSLSGSTEYYKVSDAASAGNTNVAGYSSIPSTLHVISAISLLL